MSFEEIPYKKDIVSYIFPSYEDFKSRVEGALKWNENGGPEIGTSGFIRAIIKREKLNPDQFREISQRIRKEVGIIKKMENTERAKQESSEERKKRIMMEGSIRQEQNELKRSGGIHPNDI